MGKKGGGLLHQAQKAAKQSLKQGKKQQQQQGPAAKRHKTGGAGGGPGYNPSKPNQKQQPHPQKKKAPQPKQHTEPTIPFAPDEAILLLGEGDLSFAASLATHHGCTNLTATVLERNLDELAEKYPHVHANIAKICPPSAPSTPEPEPERQEKEEDGKERQNEHSEQKQEDRNDEPQTTIKNRPQPRTNNSNRILYNIDARKFAPFVNKKPSNTGLMDRVIFNFPHVGGKSTDVNRQVRYNQELLVDFFKRAVLSLSPGGSIIVTLFEGEPYTLWNIRDLARHSGLQVDRSFRFLWGAYPGYGHVRTLGVLRDKKSGEVSGGGWKGEERLARSYVFVRKGEEVRPPGGQGAGKKKKRKRGSGDGDESSSEDEDEENYGGYEEEEDSEDEEEDEAEDGDD